MKPMSHILHITADYPDQFQQNKTQAVKSLIELTPQHEHTIYSLNRVNGIQGVTCIDRSANVTTLKYKSLPYGVLMRVGLQPVINWILNDIRENDLKPDCIHAHKFTIDGLIASKVSEEINAKLICNVWGDSDQKIIRMKPELRSMFQNVSDRATYILPATPWGWHVPRRHTRRPLE